MQQTNKVSASMKCLKLILVLLAELTCWCRSDGIMDMLSPFIDLEELAQQAAKDVANGGFTEPIDRTFPLALEEMNALMQIYHDCRTKESAAMRTWCSGGDDESYSVVTNSKDKVCPPGVKTHPCTGRVLYDNRTYEDDKAEFLWPWQGLRCDAFTDPTTVTHMYVPSFERFRMKGEALTCELASLDLSVMVSLEQLDEHTDTGCSDLSHNNLYGDFPEWLGDMTMLRLLNLEGNQLRGDVTASFAGNDALEMINLSSNNLTAVTLTFFDAFNHLQHLFVHPRTPFGDDEYMMYLMCLIFWTHCYRNLSNNKFALELPRNVFRSEFLRTINLSHNGFYGGLPQLPIYPFLEILYASANISCTRSDVSSNVLTGNIPPHLTLWGREDPHDPDEDSALAIINVSNNLFTGALPALSNLSALKLVDVHNNTFNGTFPEFPPALLLNPADLAGNTFTCPMPPKLQLSSLTCACGNGYTILRNETTANGSSHGNVDEIDLIQRLIPADQATEICLPCRGGYYSNATTNQNCLPCPAGTSSNLSGEAVDHCTLCEPGTFTEASASSSCEPCPSGTSVSKYGATSCDPCYPGQYAANQGSINCTACAVGTFSSINGATVCTPCEVGTFVSSEAEAECLLCPRDTYQDVVGSVGCKVCPVGYIAPQPGYAKCLPCTPGSYFDVDTNTCILCRPGTFTAETARTECNKCKNGTVADGFGNHECVGAAAPGFGYNGLTSLECDAGTFNDGTSRSCQSCPPGTFAESRGSQICLPCRKGSFASRKGSVSCEKAPSGSFVQFEGAVRAELCPPNSIAPRNGSTKCTLCQGSSFSFLPGGVKCSLARPGEVYEYVKWPCLALDLAGVDHNDLFHTTNGQVAPMDILLQLWMDTLSSYSTSSRMLHLVQVSQHFDSVYMTRIVVAVETTSALSTKSTGGLKNDVEDAIHEATEAAESALGDLLNTLGGSNTDGENDIDKFGDLVASGSLREALVRQFDRANLFAGILSFSMMDISMVEQSFNSTRAVPCNPGTFFSFTGRSGKSERVCLPCPSGSYSSTSGSLACELCPRGTFSPQEGLEMCQPCPVGADAASGASACEKCSWFTYECEGFWQDVIVAVCVCITLLRMLFKKMRTLSVGDQATQEQDASRALMVAVRSHGRTFDGVRYAPMGVISADTMFGSVSGTDKRLPMSRMQN
ncbi:Leucine-rich repeat receptor-like protein kinase PEPR2 [Phytophthora citrophthora]|uniref:Leucine-rich repeat receptor-like protein kinase PEPR2 n=1 Tax=Phytophthora citrophthora TaxID=4793 RepID=A0AAD9LCF8_9STRA|nr:Leucine-rich repeat receptor-like protein kinase PEPR2 [Phytophthora citrophthora]